VADLALGTIHDFLSVCNTVHCGAQVCVGVESHVPRMAFPINFFKHFCCRMYRKTCYFHSIWISQFWNVQWISLHFNFAFSPHSTTLPSLWWANWIFTGI